MFQERWLARMRAKIGLSSAEPGDGDLVGDWLDLMHRNRCDFTLTFRRLCAAAGTAGTAEMAADAPSRRADELRSAFPGPTSTMHGPRGGARAWRTSPRRAMNGRPR